MEREQVSVTIITYNEEENIRACMESIVWADEIVVVDSGSNDETVAICREYTDQVFFNPWEGMKEQNALAVDKASHPWIFSLDADERVTDILRNFILKELKNPQRGKETVLSSKGVGSNFGSGSIYRFRGHRSLKGNQTGT